MLELVNNPFATLLRLIRRFVGNVPPAPNRNRAIEDNRSTLNRTTDFPKLGRENALTFIRVIEGARIPDLRNHNPQGINENTGNADTLQQYQQQLEISDPGLCRLIEVYQASSEGQRQAILEAALNITSDTANASVKRGGK